MAKPKSALRQLALSLVPAAITAVLVAVALARAADPIKIGIGISLTGNLAANAKAGLMAMQMCVDDINAEGGLLGRPVEIIHYDDQSTASNVPPIYTKLSPVLAFRETAAERRLCLPEEPS